VLGNKPTNDNFPKEKIRFEYPLGKRGKYKKKEVIQGPLNGFQILKSKRRWKKWEEQESIFSNPQGK
jgi:hypothetical protein